MVLASRKDVIEGPPGSHRQCTTLPLTRVTPRLPMIRAGTWRGPLDDHGKLEAALVQTHHRHPAFLREVRARYGHKLKAERHYTQ